MALVLCSPEMACAAVFWTPTSSEVRPAKAPGTVPVLWFGPADRPVRELGILTAHSQFYGDALAALMKEAARRGCDVVGAIRERHVLQPGMENDPTCTPVYPGDCPAVPSMGVDPFVEAHCLAYSSPDRPASGSFRGVSQ